MIPHRSMWRRKKVSELAPEQLPPLESAKEMGKGHRDESRWFSKSHAVF